MVPGDEAAVDQGCGEAKERTDDLVLNDGHGTPDEPGSPFAAKLTQAVRIFAARASWVGSSGCAYFALGWSRRYWISEEWVATGGKPGPAKSGGAVGLRGRRGR